jgi:hypothetical protein
MNKHKIKYDIDKQKVRRDFLDQKFHHEDYTNARGGIKLFQIKDKKVRALSIKQAWFLFYKKVISPDFFTVGVIDNDKKNNSKSI